ncbi:MAG: hypothetical protein SGJ00_13890 [bacterium]|nr:hypothetical protein [bacterium]
MNRFFANFLSVIAHPVFINLLCLYLLFGLYPGLNHGLPQRVQLFYISFIFIATSLVPILVVLVMRIIGKIESITMANSEDRKFPYMVTLSMYIFSYYNFYQAPTTHPIILSYLLACAIVLAAVFFINIFDKISIHLTTLGALVGLLAGLGFMGFADLRYFVLLAILLSGAVATSRLSLNAHKPLQLYSGFFLGFFVMFLTMIFNFNFA